MTESSPCLIMLGAAIALAALVLLVSLLRAALPGLREWSAAAALAAIASWLSWPGALAGAPASFVAAASLACFLAGCLRFGGRRPSWALLGGALAVLGLVLAASQFTRHGGMLGSLAAGIYALAFGVLIALGMVRRPASRTAAWPSRGVAALALLVGFGSCAQAAVPVFPLLAAASSLGGIALALLPLAAVLLAQDALLARPAGPAHGDPLTGLPERERFEALVRERLARQRGGRPVALLLIELDHLERANQVAGRDGGDALLRDFAQLASAQLRAETVLGRLGGETFGVLLPGTSARDAWQAGERLRVAAAARAVMTPGGEYRYTISGGIASAEGGDTFERLYVRADLALYEAKQAGHDAIRLAHSALVGQGASAAPGEGGRR
ncbi:GGDEF domain-containing protein [Burkholderia gladioli]|uniref:GGDEF domain-containing protein n=1 Tax=Burkholderia gladioli TaxID=28095 RepID=UPI0038B3E302